jgi:hypothetical protein
MQGMSLEITEELIARPSPEAQAMIRTLLAKIRHRPLGTCFPEQARFRKTERGKFMLRGSV